LVPQPRKRLDLALIGRHPELSRRKAREVVEKGQVSLNGQIVREPGLAVTEKDAILWDANRRALPRARLSLPILFEDEHLIVVDKPPGLLSVPSESSAAGEDTVLARVQEYVRRLRPRRPFVGRVHRLDRDTSGALAFALSPAARQGLIRLFGEHRIERQYRAIVDGRPLADSGIVDRPLRDAYEGGKRAIAKPGEPSHPALTRWRVMERFVRGALLEVELQTGRQHQIRVHLAHIRMPVLGDAVYGPPGPRKSPVPVDRQMLHARSLGFVHPITGESVRAESTLPADFRAALSALRKLSRAPGEGTPRRRGRPPTVR
jgi:23S rRNA pseudouridine1911/1915/1917 synthase